MSRAKRRWWRWLLIGFGGLLGLIIALVLTVLWVPAASRLAIEQAADRWDQSIPGAVEWATIEGSLAGGLTITELALIDGEGRPLVRVDRLALDLRLRSLFRGTAEVERLTLTGAEVWIDHEWRDLSDPTAPDKPPSPGYGPDLPVRIIADIGIDDATVWSKGEVLATVAILELSAWGEGREAGAALGLADAALPGADLEIDSLGLALTWDEPVARILALELDAPIAEVEALDGYYDVALARGELGLDAHGQADALADRFGVEQLRAADRVELDLYAEGGPGGLETRVGVDLGEAGELWLRAEGVPAGPVAERHAELRLLAELGPGVLAEQQPPLRLELGAAIEGAASPSGFVAGVAGRIEDGRTGDQLRLEAGARVTGFDPLTGRARLDLRGLGLELAAQARREGDEQLYAELELDSGSLAEPLGFIADLLGVEQLAGIDGALALDGSCELRRPGELESLRCPVELSLARFSGFGLGIDLAELEGRVDPLAESLPLAAELEVEGLILPGGKFEFDALELYASGSLERLEVDASGRGEHERFALAGAVELDEGRTAVELDQLRLRSDRGGSLTRVRLLEPTRVTLADEALEIDGFALAAAEGRVEVDGRLGLGPDRHSDLRVDLVEVQLARLDPLVPGPLLRGELELHAALEGTLRDPDLWVFAAGRGLRIADYEPGALELAAAFGDAPTGGPPITGAPEVAPALVALLPATDPEPARAPREQDGLRLWLQTAGPLAARLAVAADIPLVLGERPRLRAGRELAVRVAVEDLELVTLGALMPDTPAWWRQVPEHAAAPPGEPKLIPEGRLDLDLALAGTPEQPRIAAAARARELAIDRTPLGSLLVRASLDQDGAGLQLAARPGFAQIDLHVHAPLRLDLAEPTLAPAIEWDQDDDHHLVSLDVRALELEELEHTLGPKLPGLGRGLAQLDLDGLLSLAVRGSGSVDAPYLSATLRGGGLAHAGQELGELRLLASYAPGQAQAELYYDGPLAERLDARLLAPVELALLSEEPLRVDSRAPIEVELHLAELAIVDLEHHVGTLPLAGQAGLDLELVGSLAAPVASLDARVEELALGGDALGRLSVHAGLADARAEVEAHLVRAGEQILVAAVEVPLIIEVPLEAGLAEAELGWDREGTHRVLLTGRNIDDELLTALFGRELSAPPGATTERETAFETQFALDISGGGRISDFAIDGMIDGSLAVDRKLSLGVRATVELDEGRQRVELSIAPNEGEGFEATVELAAAVPKLVSGEQPPAEVPFTARVDAPDFDLHCVAGLVPQTVTDPRGRLRAEFRGHGELGAPQLRGELELDDAAITVVDLRQRLSDINLGIDFADERFELRELSLAAGHGRIEGTGHAEVDPGAGFYAEVDLEIEKFPLVRPGLPAMTVDSGVGLELRQASEATTVQVILREPEVTVAGTNEAPPKPIPTSPDVHFVSDIDAELPEEEEDGDEPVEEQGRFALTLDLHETLQISGSSIDMSWAGGLELAIDNGAVEVGGELNARRGRLNLFGNDFDLRRGIVTLPDDGSLDPYLDLEAVASTPEAEVTVTVRGRVSRPALHFSSTPALSEYQILTLLITGSTELGESDSEVEARAASLLAAVSNPQLQQQLNRTLGIDRAAIGFGDTVSQPILTVGKRITRDVYVETTYHHNAPEDENTAEIGVEYNFRPRWSLESFFGDAAVGGLGVFWTRSFPPLRIGEAFQPTYESNNDK